MNRGDSRHPSPPPERIQKALARSGHGSRREVESWIAEGRLTVNGGQVEMGARVSQDDVIRLDGRRLSRSALGRTRVLLYNKPHGEVSTRRDPEGRRTVFEGIPKCANGRWIMAGRLDATTLGLLVFTNNGEVAYRLMHPSYALEREYAVRVLGTVEPETLRTLLGGVVLEDGFARFEALSEAGGEGANRWFRATLREGRTREVHRLWASQGLRVSRLIRIRYGPVVLPRGLRPGRFLEMEGELLDVLLDAVGLGASAPRGGPRHEARPVRRPSRRSGR